MYLMLKYMYPPSKYIYLYRRNKIQQGVSTFFASRTGQHNSYDKVVRYQINYEFDAISGIFETLKRTSEWVDISHLIPGLKVCYEDLYLKNEETLDKMEKFLDFPLKKRIQTHCKKINHPLKNRFVKNYINDTINKFGSLISKDEKNKLIEELF